MWYNRRNRKATKIREEKVMKQTTFSDIEYYRKRITKREEFLDIMEEIIPWEEWVDLCAHIIHRESVADLQRE